MAVSFQWAMEHDVARFIVSPGCKTENIGLFTNQRVDRKTLSRGWYAYDIRTNSNGTLCSLEPNVVVNHGGTFLTKTPVKMNSRGFHSLTGKAGYTFDT